MAALELRIDAELALGRHGIIVGELQGLIEAHPLRERLWRQLMLALYRDGRQAEALAAYRSARTRLVEEIGIEPGRELQALEARILAQDPGLAADVTDAPPARARRSVLALPDAGGARRWRAGRRRAARRACRPRAAGRRAARRPRSGGRRERAARARCASALARRGVDARVAAFATADRGADAVRLAAEQDAAVLVLAAPEERCAPAPSGAICRTCSRTRSATWSCWRAPRTTRRPRRARSWCRSPATTTTGPRSRWERGWPATRRCGCSACAARPAATPAGCWRARPSRFSAAWASRPSRCSSARARTR